MIGTARARSELARSGFSARIMCAIVTGAIFVLAPALRADAVARFTFTLSTQPNFQPVNAEVSAFEANSGAMQPRPGNDNMYATRTLVTTPEAAQTDFLASFFNPRFSFHPLNGQHFDLQSITFQVAASKAPSAAQDQLAATMLYVSGVAQAIGLASGFDTTNDGLPGNFTTFTFPLTDPAFRDVSGTVVFTFYVYGADSNSLIAFDNIELLGVPITPPPPTIKITSVTRMTGQHFIIKGETSPGYIVSVQAAPDLFATRTQIGSTVADGIGGFTFDENFGTTVYTSRFYWVSAASP